MKFSKKAIVIFSVVLIIALLIILKLTVYSKPEEAAGPKRGGPGGRTLKVNITVVQPTELSGSVRTVGTILPNEEVTLVSEVNGRVTAIHFREGTSVRKGELLVKINDSELQAQYEKALSRKKILEDREYRERILLEKNATSRELYDAALNELNANKADIDLIAAQIEKTEIRAPFYGTTGLRYISEGAYVNPTIKITTLQKMDSVKIDFSLPERYFGIVKNGDRITFTLDGVKGKFNAKVYAIEPKIDFTTRSLKARAVAVNPGYTIPGGAFADIELPMMRSSGSIVLPAEVLTPDVLGYKVFIYDNGRAVTRPVEIGFRDEKQVIITSGLKAGDTVITSGIINLRPNSPVTLGEVSVRE
ncbi:MAG: efflux RND transporter periplasmic adaptor subunit [Ignavibacteriales bacterium]|nr:Multidrug resistance protein MdtA [Ignavibacteriaceae bacterium]QOJ29068.1 MAG: efflux RND transporter periplasmic adaptor subunit [Ignavibacteriales bacterium]